MIYVQCKLHCFSLKSRRLSFCHCRNSFLLSISYLVRHPYLNKNDYLMDRNDLVDKPSYTSHRSTS